MSIQKNKTIVSLHLLCVVMLSACTEAPDTPVQEHGGIWPGEEWATSTPGAEGVAQAVIDGIVNDINAGTYGAVDQFLFIKNGKVIADHVFGVNYDAILAAHEGEHPHLGILEIDHQYNYDHPNWHPYYNGTKLHSMQSVTKSVTSAALGIAIDDGLIEGVQVPIAQFFEDYEYDRSDPRKADITLEDFLTMRSGIIWNNEAGYDDPEHNTNRMELSNEWIQFVLDKPMYSDPGQIYEYHDGVSVLIGKIARQVTGKRMDLWASERLFEPIGIDDFYWKISPDGEADTEGGLYLTTHDLARIGYLFLRHGNWNGKQIISEKWVKASIHPVVDFGADNDKPFDSGYGYQWWVEEDEDGEPSIFVGNGYGGQFLMVAPKHDIIVVFNGWDLHKEGDKSTYGILQERILPSMKE